MALVDTECIQHAYCAFQRVSGTHECVQHCRCHVRHVLSKHALRLLTVCPPLCCQDVETLVDMLTYEHGPALVLSGEEEAPGVRLYAPPSTDFPEFSLRRFTPLPRNSGGHEHERLRVRECAIPPSSVSNTPLSVPNTLENAEFWPRPTVHPRVIFSSRPLKSAFWRAAVRTRPRNGAFLRGHVR